MVLPVALYGSEIWGHDYCENIEAVQYTFCRRLLALSSNVNKVALLGETGRLPLAVHYHYRCVKYWLKLLQLPSHRYPSACYKMLYNLDRNGRYTWATSVRTMLCQFGFEHVWTQQGVGNESVFLNVFKLRVSDYYRADWLSRIRDSSKLAIYSSFKCELVCEKYVNVLTVRKYLEAFSRLRCSNHPLAIETGRYLGTLLEDRTCILCLKQKIIVLEDEYHFLLCCDSYKDIRDRYITKYLSENGNLYQSFISIMSTGDASVVYDVSCYAYHAFKQRKLLLDTVS